MHVLDESERRVRIEFGERVLQVDSDLFFIEWQEQQCPVICRPRPVAILVGEVIALLAQRAEEVRTTRDEHATARMTVVASTRP